MEINRNLERTEAILDYYNQVNHKEQAMKADIARIIKSATDGYSLDDVKYVIDRSSGVGIYALFTRNYFDTCVQLKAVVAQRDEYKAKAPVENETAKSLDILGTALVSALKETKGDELIQFAKDYIESTYGITEKKVNLYNPVNGNKIDGVTHEAFERVCEYVQADEALMLMGPAGSGKNVLVEQVAEFLGYPVYEANAVQNAYDLTGFIDANGNFQNTEFYDACKTASEGNDVIFLFDEVDASVSEVLVKFNNALASGVFPFPNEKLKFKGKLHIIACANTFGTGATMEYVGRNTIDFATLDRFAVMQIYYSQKIEETLCPDSELLAFCRAFRKCVEANEIHHIVSYRGIKRLYKMMFSFGERTRESKKEILKECLIKNLESDDLGMFCNQLPHSNQYAELVREIAGE